MRTTVIALGTGAMGMAVGAYLLFRFMSRALDGTP